MEVSLTYAKVVDRDAFQRQGAVVRPGTDSGIKVPGEPPATAAPFLVLRTWKHADGAFTERWRLVDPHGRTVREPVEREVLPPDPELADEILDQLIEYDHEGYQLVLEVDGREIARADLPVQVDSDGSTT